MLLAIAASAVVWMRMARKDSRLPWIYLAGLIAAFAGSKVVYLLAEGWRDLGDPHWLIRWATGKTILGGLLAGYAGVEYAKKAIGYREPTGDRFAVVVPLGIGLGRVGCLVHGCCLGQPCAPAMWTVTDARGVARWPAVPLEIAFNVGMALVLAGLQRAGRFRHQSFHLYLMAYGVFRFLHEFVRDTPRIVGPFSGYHLAAAAVAILGGIRYRQRQRGEMGAPSSCQPSSRDTESAPSEKSPYRHGRRTDR
ncbi:MAG: prolipoprotein diacylglyceryl transferase [Verrucomicrobiales bacterium]|nr:prolipoprotein diacylglyceryl transferase [Verrucomicrobiales bacterium]